MPDLENDSIFKSPFKSDDEARGVIGGLSEEEATEAGPMVWVGVLVFVFDGHCAGSPRGTGRCSCSQRRTTAELVCTALYLPRSRMVLHACDDVDRSYHCGTWLSMTDPGRRT